MQRRGQDSNLQSSGHEPDELTNSSTPLLPLIFLSRIEPAFRLRLGAELLTTGTNLLKARASKRKNKG